ncbi:MAG: phosphoribosyltransferase family protein [Jiangellales bacterium]
MPRTPHPYSDRAEAGRRLGQAVSDRLGDAADDVVVLGLPRGGVVVAAEVADALGAPLDVLVVRKIGAPGRPELAMGALAAGTEVRNADVVHALGIDDVTFAAAAEAERARAQARERTYRGIHPATPLDGRTAVVVDDGLATGATARAAVTALRHRTDDRPQRVVLAVPVAPGDGLDGLSRLVDDVVCLSTPRPFLAVGEWYRDFAQVSDDEVRALLRRREVV